MGFCLQRAGSDDAKSLYKRVQCRLRRSLLKLVAFCAQIEPKWACLGPKSTGLSFQISKFHCSLHCGEKTQLSRPTVAIKRRINAEKVPKLRSRPQIDSLSQLPSSGHQETVSFTVKLVSTAVQGDCVMSCGCLPSFKSRPLLVRVSGHSFSCPTPFRTRFLQFRSHSEPKTLSTKLPNNVFQRETPATRTFVHSGSMTQEFRTCQRLAGVIFGQNH